jgi:RNA polymerase sigma-70 factor (subfamily 1)
MKSNLSDERHSELLAMIRRAKNGDKEALGKLLHDFAMVFRRQVRRHPAHCLRSKARRSDAIQMLSVKVCEHFDQFRGDSPEELWAWMWATVENCMKNLYSEFCESKKRQVQREVSLDDPHRRRRLYSLLKSALPGPPVQVVQNEDVDRLHMAMEELPEEYQHDLTAHYSDGLSYKRIGRLSHRSPGAVRQTCIRAIEKLRWLLL